MSIPLFQVDAFTATPFAGNPAAVCLLSAPAEAAWMQSVAREMNLSETAFLHQEDGAYRLRWREDYDVEPMMGPGEVAVIDIDLWSTANVFNKGHRIAVHVTSSNDPRFDPNPNTGAPLRSSAETRVAKNTLFHDAYRPSRLIAPVMDIKNVPPPAKPTAGAN